MGPLRSNWLVALALLAVPPLIYFGIITTRTGTDNSQLVVDYVRDFGIILVAGVLLFFAGRAFYRSRRGHSSGAR